MGRGSMHLGVRWNGGETTAFMARRNSGGPKKRHERKRGKSTRRPFWRCMQLTDHNLIRFAGVKTAHPSVAAIHCSGLQIRLGDCPEGGWENKAVTTTLGEHNKKGQGFVHRVLSMSALAKRVFKPPL